MTREYQSGVFDYEMNPQEMNALDDEYEERETNKYEKIERDYPRFYPQDYTQDLHAK